MKIGIDLRPLQNGHKYRGIGEVAKQVTGRILEYGKKDGVQFCFFINSDSDPFDLLSIPKGLEYETVDLGLMPEGRTSSSSKEKIIRTYNQLYGSPIANSHEVDVFLQYDYAAGVPRNTRTVLVKHDLIPYVFWDHFFESAWVPFKNRAARTALRTLFTNRKFLRVLRRGLRNAHVIMAVSNSTKKDVEQYFRVNSEKVKVARLGVDARPSKTGDHTDSVLMPTKPYLLFIGAGDERRRVDDLVAAYNMLKSQGHDIQLVLAGENFKSPESIPVPFVREAVMKSSYKRDILTLGYISDEQKQELYKNAIAYVYPTLYEGFGIPILEAMLLNCPVVVYKNSSTGEVGGKHATYADSWASIVERVEDLIGEPVKARALRLEKAKQYAESFTWDQTARTIYDELKVAGK